MTTHPRRGYRAILLLALAALTATSLQLAEAQAPPANPADEDSAAVALDAKNAVERAAQSQNLAQALSANLSADASAFDATATWHLPKAAYGQFKLVPNHPEATSDIRARDWSGPWTAYPYFFVYFGYTHGEQIQPGRFHYVEPSINLQGWQTGGQSQGRRQESSGTTVKLFEDASTVADIKITCNNLPPRLEIGQEYKVATVSSTKTSLSWDVYVRFMTTKPSYITAAAP